MLRGTQGCFPLWSGAVLGEEGHRTASLLREAPSRQDRGPGTCPPKGRGRAVGSLGSTHECVPLACPQKQSGKGS